MAEHALGGDGAPKIFLIASVVSRAHRPISRPFAIPAHGQLDQPSLRVAMEEGPRMIAGTDDIIHLLFDDIGFFPRNRFGAALKQLAVFVLLQHRIAHSGRLIIHAGAVELRKVSGRTDTLNDRPMPGCRIRLRNLLMTTGTDTGST